MALKTRSKSKFEPGWTIQDALTDALSRSGTENDYESSNTKENNWFEFDFTDGKIAKSNAYSLLFGDMDQRIFALSKIEEAVLALQSLPLADRNDPEIQAACTKFLTTAASPTKNAELEGPTVVPSELWASRTSGRKESPAAFIRRVYAKELAKGTLTRPALRASDFRLAQAFDTWARRHPIDAELVPTKGPVFVTDADRLQVRREKRALRNARYRSRKMTETPSLS